MLLGNTYAMTRGGVAKSKIFLLSSCRVAKRVEQRYFSKLSGTAEGVSRKEESRKRPEMESPSTWSSSWVPDPRTGIYFPKGHERVMDDIPKGAASLNNQTFWLRNLDGVLEKPDPDTSPDHYYQMHM
ncbi:hypothetical protein ACLB2K_012182 [Fragaria x ananassa]